jgi:hypothetical protein
MDPQIFLSDPDPRIRKIQEANYLRIRILPKYFVAIKKITNNTKYLNFPKFY